MSSERCVMSVPGKAKKERKTITIEKKMDVIRRMESGERRSAVCKALHLAPSTVSTIMGNVDKIKRTYTGATRLSSSRTTYSRSEAMEEMEKLLVLWVEDSNRNNVLVTQAVVLEKAKTLFDEICMQSGSTETFNASKGWFHRFKNRTKIQITKVSGEATNINVAEIYPFEFKRLIDEGTYQSDLVFSVGEVGLYWKKLPNGMYIACEEEVERTDHLTLFLGGNASGTFKLKPMLVYHSEVIMKDSEIPVLCRCSEKLIFSDWYTTYFCPEVAQFCAVNGLPPKVMLVLDNAPGNLQETDNDQLEVEIVCLPPHASTLLKPLDQGVIATFNACYLRAIFRGIADAVQSDAKISDHWKSYDIFKGITNIDSAWEEVSRSCMNSAWSKLWPEAVINFTGSESISDIIDDICGISKLIGIDVQPDDVELLLKSHFEPPPDKDLLELAEQKLEQQKTAEEVEELKPTRMLETKHVQSFLDKIRCAFEEICDNDPDWERSHGIQSDVNILLKPYYKILEERSAKLQHSPS
ncbi:PREDICTED: tigger transposable element-derived protein 1-like [Nicrophorus vespilloides]|uniref:Tigger transposable element-derived protein 1-like n=1 Tax=Nicrophorus vespilloides TaxID=110193 RepID=A0ABM1ME26_NICVS|nr:PREDICTED: tigger transposable element-derived protein 1-like [Nicrophorus vespilloides]